MHSCVCYVVYSIELVDITGIMTRHLHCLLNSRLIIKSALFDATDQCISVSAETQNATF